MRKVFTNHGKSGFTLLELLTVMAIMVVMMSIAGASYYGMSRGAAMRGSVSNLTTALSLARQFAVNHRNRTHVMLWNDGTNSNYQVFVEAGRQVGNVAARLELENPKFGTKELLGGDIYNLTKEEDGVVGTAVITTNSTGMWVTQIIATNNATGGIMLWGLGNKAAWSIQGKMSLMDGIEFDDNDVPITAVFKPDGTAVKPITTLIKETRGPATKTVSVKITGKISSY